MAEVHRKAHAHAPEPDSRRKGKNQSKDRDHNHEPVKTVNSAFSAIVRSFELFANFEFHFVETVQVGSNFWRREFGDFRFAIEMVTHNFSGKISPVMKNERVAINGFLRVSNGPVAVGQMDGDFVLSLQRIRNPERHLSQSGAGVGQHVNQTVTIKSELPLFRRRIQFPDIADSIYSVTVRRLFLRSSEIFKG